MSRGGWCGWSHVIRPLLSHPHHTQPLIPIQLSQPLIPPHPSQPLLVNLVNPLLSPYALINPSQSLTLTLTTLVNPSLSPCALINPSQSLTLTLCSNQP